MLLSNIGPDSGTATDLAHFSHQLFFTLDIYRKKTRRHFGARVGIHSEFVPVEMCEENGFLNIWSSMGTFFNLAF
jgi:hypothetical protein